MHEEEVAYFEQYKEGLYALYEGTYILIKGRRLIGVYQRQDHVFAEAAAYMPCLIRYLGLAEQHEGFRMPGINK
jgi:hypothetical protein